jgi:DNA-binding transcriptional regulator YiaG
MSTVVDPIETAAALARARDSLPSPEERRRLRESAGVTVAAVAAVVGVSRAAVTRWEAGERSPRGDHVHAYIDVLSRLKRMGH